jgi:hypothetical protein
MQRLIIVLLGSLAIGAGGCHGSVSSAVCSTSFTPCGGDITDTWAAPTFCGATA